MVKNDESEWKTREKRIDPKLDAAVWQLARGQARQQRPFRAAEEETENGPAEYVLWPDPRMFGSAAPDA